jgi:hypothetical protein
MPASVNGYQRIIVKGIPAWKKDDSLYLYDTDVSTNPIKIGTVSEGFSTGWYATCSAKLETYRKEMVSRVRRVNAVASKKK